MPQFPPPLVLASASPRRKALLAQLGVCPAAIHAAEIDETPARDELPVPYARRMAREKATAVQYTDHAILAADTVVHMGRRILPKALDEATARQCLQRLSGRRHRVTTAVALQLPDGTFAARDVTSAVKFARLTEADITTYLATGEWKDKAGGYAIQGQAAAFIPWISGSHSAIVGLPLYETRCLLQGNGLITAISP